MKRISDWLARVARNLGGGGGNSSLQLRKRCEGSWSRKRDEKKSLKRGGDLQRHPLENVQIEARRPPEEILALHEALNRLAEIDPAKADLVKLRYFVGMTIAEAAEVLEISPSSVDRLWAYARAWLHQEMTKGDRSV